MYNPISMRAPSEGERPHHNPVSGFERGFLPPKDPLVTLPTPYSYLDILASNIPQLLRKHELRATLDELEPFSTDSLTGPALRRANMLCGFLGSAYVHAIGEELATRIPQGVAIPLYETATRLDLPPILTYQGYALDNWRRTDPTGPIEIENLEVLTTFSGLSDESWFIRVHLEIEAEAAGAIAALEPLQAAVAKSDRDLVERHLTTIDSATSDMVSTLQRMDKGTSPDVFATDFRPYFFFFDNVSYDGVDAFEGQPQAFRGETGAQSSIMPVFDVALRVPHQQTGMTDHISAMRLYMPKPHRALITGVEQGPSVREFVLAQRAGTLRDLYNSSLTNMAAFREQNLTWADNYIASKVANPLGTGKTPFMDWLRMLHEETLAARI